MINVRVLYTPIIIISNRLRSRLRYTTLQFQLLKLGILEHGALKAVKFLD